MSPSDLSFSGRWEAFVNPVNTRDSLATLLLGPPLCKAKDDSDGRGAPRAQSSSGKQRGFLEPV